MAPVFIADILHKVEDFQSCKSLLFRSSNKATRKERKKHLCGTDSMEMNASCFQRFKKSRLQDAALYLKSSCDESVDIQEGRVYIP